MKCSYFPKSSGKAGGIACYKVASLTTETEYLSQQPWKKSFILTHQFQGFQSILTRRHGSLASSMASRGGLFTCDRQEVERTELRQLEPSKAWCFSYTRQTPAARTFQSLAPFLHQAGPSFQRLPSCHNSIGGLQTEESMDNILHASNPTCLLTESAGAIIIMR